MIFSKLAIVNELSAVGKSICNFQLRRQTL